MNAIWNGNSLQSLYLLNFCLTESDHIACFADLMYGFVIHICVTSYSVANCKKIEACITTMEQSIIIPLLDTFLLLSEIVSLFINFSDRLSVYSWEINQLNYCWFVQWSLTYPDPTYTDYSHIQTHVWVHIEIIYIESVSVIRIFNYQQSTSTDKLGTEVSG